MADSGGALGRELGGGVRHHVPRAEVRDGLVAAVRSRPGNHVRTWRFKGD